MEYPRDFPSESRAAVAAEKLRAGKDFDLVLDSLSVSSDIEEQIRKYVLRQLLVFVQEASKLGRRGIWQVDKVENAALEFLRRATIDAISNKGRGLGKHWISNTSGSLTEKCRFEKSAEWQQYEDMLLQLAEWQATRTASANAKALTEPKRRQSYHAEVKAWMALKHLGTLAEAARCLGIDLSALKSIMSSQGRLRCGQGTLNRVLGTIGYKGA